MLKQTLYLLLFLLAGECIQGQPKKARDTIVLPEKISRFIPKGYIVTDTAMGNLNLDKYTDIVLVLKATAEDTAEHPGDYKRPLILLSGGRDHTFKFAARNDNILMEYESYNPFGGSYEGIRITNGLFRVQQITGGSSIAFEEEIAFKFSAKDKTWYLFNVVEETWERVRTRNSIEKGNAQTTTYTQKDFGRISIKKYTDWRQLVPASD